MANNENQEKLNNKFLSGVSTGSSEQVIAAIEQGANINAVTVQGNNALFVAAINNEVDAFEWLLTISQADKKIDINRCNNKGNSILAELARKGGKEFFIKKLIEAGAELNLKNNDGLTAIMVAIQEDRQDLVKLFADSGANVNEVTNSKTQTTPLLMAVSEGKIEAVKILHAAGADINAVSSEKSDPLLTAMQKPLRFLKESEKKEFQDLVNLLLDLGVSTEHVTSNGTTAILLSLLDPTKRTFFGRILEKQKNTDIWYTDMNERTSLLHNLFRVSPTVNKEVLDLILSKGAKFGEVDSHGNKPESYAFTSPQNGKLVLDYNIDVNAIYNNGNVSFPLITLSLASSTVLEEGLVDEMDPLEITKLLIQKGAKLNYDNHKMNPLVMAIVNNNLPAVKLLIDSGIDINKRFVSDNVKFSFIDILVGIEDKNSYKQQAEKFLKILSNVTDENIPKGTTKQDYVDAIQKKQIEIEEKLKKELDTRKEIFNLIIDAGFDFNQYSNTESPYFKVNMAECIDWLLERNIDINKKNENSENVLSYAIIKNKSTSIINKFKQLVNEKDLDRVFYDLAFLNYDQALVQNNVQSGLFSFLGEEVSTKLSKAEAVSVNGINYADEEGNSPFMVACSRNIPFLASLYIKLGADVNKPNNNGEYPVMHAALAKNIELVKLLVDNGAKLDVESIDGITFKDVVESLDDSEFVAQLNTVLPNRNKSHP